MSCHPVFTEIELETIETLVEQYGPTWIETRLDQVVVASILLKIEKHLNG